MKWLGKQLFRLALWYVNQHIRYTHRTGCSWTTVNIPFEPGSMNTCTYYSWTFPEGYTPHDSNENGC